MRRIHGTRLVELFSIKMHNLPHNHPGPLLLLQVFVVFFAMDMMLWGKHASNAVPATTMLALLALWYSFFLFDNF